MIEEQGRVVSVVAGEPGNFCIEAIRQSSCSSYCSSYGSSCSVRSGCGQHLSETYQIDTSFIYINAISSLPLKEGDSVLVGIPEGSLLKASFLIYLFPLLLLMPGVWLLSLLAAADWVLLLAAGLLLFCGFGIVRMIGKRLADMCRIEVVKVLPSEGVGLSGDFSRQRLSFRHD